MRTFAKNTAHSERRFKINAYLCIRGGRTVAVKTKEAFSFFQTENFDNSHEKMEKKDVLPLFMIVVDCIQLLHTRV